MTLRSWVKSVNKKYITLTGWFEPWMLIGWQQWCIPRVWQNMYFYCSNYVGNQFIIAIRHRRGLWDMANTPWLRAVSRHSVLCHIPHAYCLNSAIWRPVGLYITHIYHTSVDKLHYVMKNWFILQDILRKEWVMLLDTFVQLLY